MGNPILYVTAFNDLASVGGDNPVAILPEDGTQTRLYVLGTIGGGLTFTITSAGLNLNTGTYLNLPAVGVNAKGAGLTLNVTVAAGGGGAVTAVVPAAPGSGYQIGDTVTVLTTGVLSTAAGVMTTLTVATVLPVSQPLPPGTKFVEIACDGGGPAWYTLDSTLSSVGLSNGLITSQQSTLGTTSGRIAANERLLRRVGYFPRPVQGAGGAGFAQPIGLQVIMGTAAA
jgi:hypothetical protein